MTESPTLGSCTKGCGATSYRSPHPFIQNPTLLGIDKQSLSAAASRGMAQCGCTSCTGCAHFSFMYEGFFSHSPFAAQWLHAPVVSLSWQAGSGAGTVTDGGHPQEAPQWAAIYA
eukprot:scaffold20134_cov113-Isochrysis_galbana.AAC.3